MTLSPRPHTRTWPALALALMFALSTAACGFCNAEDDAGEGETEAPEKTSEDDKDKAKDKKAAEDKPKRADAKDPKAAKKTPRSVKDKKNALAKRADAKPAITDKIKRPDIKNVKKPGTGIDMDFAKKGALAAKKPGKVRADDPPASPTATKLEDTLPQKKDEGTKDLAEALTRGGVRTATGYSKMLRPGPLVGIEADKSYDALRLKPTDRNKFGVALQVWREKNPGAQSRKFNDLMRQYPDSKRTRDLGDTSFKAGWGGMSYIVWLDRKNKLIAAISCDGDICKDDAAALKLASSVAKKLR